MRPPPCALHLVEGTGPARPAAPPACWRCVASMTCLMSAHACPPRCPQCVPLFPVPRLATGDGALQQGRHQAPRAPAAGRPRLRHLRHFLLLPPPASAPAIPNDAFCALPRPSHRGRGRIRRPCKLAMLRCAPVLLLLLLVVGARGAPAPPQPPHHEPAEAGCTATQAGDEPLQTCAAATSPCTALGTGPRSCGLPGA